LLTRDELSPTSGDDTTRIVTDFDAAQSVGASTPGVVSRRSHGESGGDQCFHGRDCNFPSIQLFMSIDFDREKDEANLRKHGMSLADAANMEIGVALPDNRKDYGEHRWRAFGYIDGLACCMAFTIRNNRVRVISLRRAHSKEMKRYAP